MAVLENEKIERHIMKNVPGGYNLFVQDKEVATLIENLYSVSNKYNIVLLVVSLIIARYILYARLLNISQFAFHLESYFVVIHSEA